MSFRTWLVGTAGTEIMVEMKRSGMVTLVETDLSPRFAGWNCQRFTESMAYWSRMMEPELCATEALAAVPSSVTVRAMSVLVLCGSAAIAS